jgi:hypothetical protein
MSLIGRFCWKNLESQGQVYGGGSERSWTALLNTEDDLAIGRASRVLKQLPKVL